MRGAGKGGGCRRQVRGAGAGGGWGGPRNPGRCGPQLLAHQNEGVHGVFADLQTRRARHLQKQIGSRLLDLRETRRTSGKSRVSGADASHCLPGHGPSPEGCAQADGAAQTCGRSGTAHLRLLAVGYGREGDDVAVCVQQAGVLLLAVQQVEVPVRERPVPAELQQRARGRPGTPRLFPGARCGTQGTPGGLQGAGVPRAPRLRRVGPGASGHVSGLGETLWAGGLPSWGRWAMRLPAPRRRGPAPAPWGLPHGSEGNGGPCLTPRPPTHLCRPETVCLFLCLRCSSASSCSCRTRSLALTSLRPRGTIFGVEMAGRSAHAETAAQTPAPRPSPTLAFRCLWRQRQGCARLSSVNQQDRRGDNGPTAASPPAPASRAVTGAFGGR